MSFNNTSKIVPCRLAPAVTAVIFPTTGKIAHQTNVYGVILPQSGKMLCQSDIDSKIQKTKNQIAYLSNAQSSKSHGGKRFRGRQISLRDQINSAKEHLNLLKSAKETLVKVCNKKKSNDKVTLNQVTLVQSVACRLIANQARDYSYYGFLSSSSLAGRRYTHNGISVQL